MHYRSCGRSGSGCQIQQDHIQDKKCWYYCRWLFLDLKADIQFDPKNLDKSVLKASVGAATIKTGIKKRDKDLQMRKYFDVEKYPRIKMTAKKISTLKRINIKEHSILL